MVDVKMIELEIIKMKAEAIAFRDNPKNNDPLIKACSNVEIKAFEKVLELFDD